MTHPVPTEGREGQQHTPGPWAVMKHWPLEIVPIADAEKRLGGASDPARDAEYAQPVAKACFDSFAGAAEYPHRRVNHAESLANARLIAAAPELLAALRIIAEFPITDPNNMDAANMQMIARAWIAKAEGR